MNPFIYLCLYSQDETGPGQLEPWLVKEMDSCISSIFLNEDQDAFIQLINLILYENVNGRTPSPRSCLYEYEYTYGLKKKKNKIMFSQKNQRATNKG